VQIIKATLDHCNARNRLLAPSDFSAGDDKGGSFRDAMRAQVTPKDFFKAFLVTRKALCEEKRSDQKSVPALCERKGWSGSPGLG
jgi:hypothetical protein